MAEEKVKKAEEKKEDLGEKLAESEKKKDEYLAGWQRARADFLNYKKEEAKRLGSLAFFAQAEVILNILPILDNFEKAFQENQKDSETIQGFLQIKKQVEEVLKNFGVEEIKTIGEKFDPNFAEAKEEIEVKDKEQGIIVEEIQKGYTLQGKIIRPAKVRVAK